MGYKCKNCGYQFREGDGDICPECLTPIEQSADCSQYHSHEAFEDKGFSNPAYGNPSYSQRDYQQATFSTNTVQKPKKKNGFLKAIIIIIILVVISNVVLPLLTSHSFKNMVQSVVSEAETIAPDDEYAPEVSAAAPQDNTLAVGESLDINATVKDNNVEFNYLKLTNLGQAPNGIDFGENHQIYALDIEIIAPIKEYSSSDLTYIYFSPKIEANFVNNDAKVKKDISNLYSMPNTAGILPNQLDNSLIIQNGNTIKGTLYYDVDTQRYTNKALVVEFDYYDDAGKHHDGKITLAQIDTEKKK